MTAEPQATFTEDPPRADAVLHPTDALLLQLDNFEGPIDILLQLARDQKVDLTNISILQLARQYLSFIDRAQALSLDIAAEYLVMAAWLAYLKSRLLLPKTEEAGDEPSADMIAEALAYQLRRLEAVQQGAQKLGQRMRLFLTVYPRGIREKFESSEPDKYKVDLYQLLKAYGDITQRKTSSKYELVAYDVMSMEDAMRRLTRMLGHLPRNDASSIWATLHSFVPEKTGTPLFARSSLASILTASLELAKEGKLELRQDGLFRPIYLRAVERPNTEIPLMTQSIEEILIEDEEAAAVEESSAPLIALEDPAQQKRLIEALLFASPEPVSIRMLQNRLPDSADVGGLLLEIQADYAERGVNLVRLEDVWAFRSASDLGSHLALARKEEKKLSRAALETMAIIAYHQPVTRAEVENIRGVATSKGTLDVLLEAGWIKPGRRLETPGRPLTWITTNVFLDEFGVSDLKDLPGLQELKAAGLLDTRPAIETIPGADLFTANENIPSAGESEDGDNNDEEEESL